MLKKRVLIPVASGSDETEVASFMACFVRAPAEIKTACIGGDFHRIVRMYCGAKIQADIRIEDAVDQEWDLILLPGGEQGAVAMRDCTELMSLLHRQKTAGRLYAASGASPALVLAPDLIQPGATCYPLMRYRAKIPNVCDDDVVIQDGLVTSQGVGCALVFGCVLVEKLYDRMVADRVAVSMMVDRTGRIGYRYHPAGSFPLFNVLIPDYQPEAQVTSATAAVVAPDGATQQPELVAVVSQSSGSIESATERTDHEGKQSGSAVQSAKGVASSQRPACSGEEEHEDEDEEWSEKESVTDSSISGEEPYENVDEIDEHNTAKSSKRKQRDATEPAEQTPRQRLKPGSNVLDWEVVDIS